MALFKEMRGRGLEPDMITYSMAIIAWKSCSMEEGPAQGLRWREEALACLLDAASRLAGDISFECIDGNVIAGFLRVLRFVSSTGTVFPNVTEATSLWQRFRTPVQGLLHLGKIALDRLTLAQWKKKAHQCLDAVDIVLCLIMRSGCPAVLNHVALLLPEWAAKEAVLSHLPRSALLFGKKEGCWTLVHAMASACSRLLTPGMSVSRMTVFPTNSETTY